LGSRPNRLAYALRYDGKYQLYQSA